MYLCGLLALLPLFMALFGNPKEKGIGAMLFLLEIFIYFVMLFGSR